MDQHFNEVVNFNLPGSEEISYQDLPLISSHEIDGFLAALENQPPIAPFTEVKNNFGNILLRQRVAKMLRKLDCWNKTTIGLKTT